MTNSYIPKLAVFFGIDEDLLRYEYEWREGSRVIAKSIARAYIDSKRELFEPVLGSLTLEQLVSSVEMARLTGRIGDRIILDMWILSEFEPQQVTGVIDVKLPRPAALLEALNGNLQC